MPASLNTGVLTADVIATIGQLLQEGTRDRSNVRVRIVTQADERVRPSHAALHNTVWHADDSERPVPPFDYGCRCEEEFFAVDEETAEKTGLPVQPKNPPEPGNEALDSFFNEATQSGKTPSSNKKDPKPKGSPVTPEDIFGPVISKEIEDKRIEPIEAFSAETGEVRPASEVKDIAKAPNKGAQRKVIAAFAALSVLAIRPTERTRILRLAREILAEKPSLKDEQALFIAIMRLKPGNVSPISLTGNEPSTTTVRANARRVAKQIRRANGPL